MSVTAGRRIGVALVGTGMVAKAHARSLNDLSALVDVRGVYSRDAVRRSAFADEFGFSAMPSLQAILADPAVETVIVITPPNARLEIVEACTRAGKHLLLEKPLERTPEAAHRIVRLCADAGVRLGVVFQERLRPEARALRALIESQELGAVVAGQVVVPWWRPQSYYDVLGRGTYARDGGGVLITQAIHMLDLMRVLMGRVEEVQAMAGTTRLHQMESEDSVTAGLRFANGALGTVWATTASYPGAPESISIDFERGSARLSGGTLTVARHDGTTETIGAGDAQTGGGADPMAFSHSRHRSVIEDFVQAVRDDREPLIRGAEALETQLIIEAMIASGREQRAVRFSEIAAGYL
jgi:UDP-N-acetyl-2-amino-2-deoxyglucuronate dehydrogenase